MSSASPVLEILDWRPVAETLAALQTECAQSEELIEELFAELEKRRTEVAQKAAELEAERGENRRLSEQFEKWGQSLQERLAGAQVSNEGAAPRPATELELERAALLAELEQVRARAAELHESLLEQQQEHAEQNERLASEIQSLRQWIERNAEMRDASPREDMEVDEGSASPGLPSAAAGADPVVSSVMAQFAQLQRDVAKRRKRK